MILNAFSRGIHAAQKFLFESSVFRRNVVLSCSVGVTAFLISLAFRIGLDAAIPDFPFITFIPAVIISAFLAGSRAGVICAVLSFLAAWYWFVDPNEPFSTSLGAVVGLSLFTIIVSVAIAVIGFAARAVQDQHKTQVALEDALKAKEVLLYEINHRVKNNLQLISSFLLLEAAKIDSIEARSAVMIARSKLDVVSQLYRILYESDSHDRVDLKTILEDIANHLIVSAGRDDVRLQFGFSGDLIISLRQASPLVLTVNEIITNSLKYGLSSEQPQLTVSATGTNDEITLVIRDNGLGITAVRTGNKPHMGNEIIKGLVSQMRGTLAIQSDGTGTTNVLTVPFEPQSSDRKSAS